MTTLREIYQYRLHQLSAKIELMKTDILNDYPAGKDSHRYMNPKHPTWIVYQGLKHQASICLTAHRIFRYSSDKIPNKSNFRKALREHRKVFTTHCPKGDLIRQNVFLFEAFVDLEQTGKDMKLNPTRFVEAETYAQQRRLEIVAANANKAKEAAGATA